MTAAARVWLQHLLPKRFLSAAVYRVSRSRKEWIKKPLIGWFARTYGVDLSEAEHSDLGRYPTFNAFFTRALRDGVRPIAGDEATIVSPADGTLSEFGTVTDGELLQAKGMRYALAELLGKDLAATAGFVGGTYLTIYLAPHNYHRVHVPIAGTLTGTTYIPGERFSVSAAVASAIEGLYCRNERVVCSLETTVGEIALVLVGALNVGSISTVTRGEIASGPERNWPEPQPVSLGRGAEIARFNLGSTVIVLFGRGAARWDDGLVRGAELRVGQPIGRLAGVAAAAPADHGRAPR
jgi:phosphatidylserine decarboxylase